MKFSVHNTSKTTVHAIYGAKHRQITLKPGSKIEAELDEGAASNLRMMQNTGAAVHIQAIDHEGERVMALADTRRQKRREGKLKFPSPSQLKEARGETLELPVVDQLKWLDPEPVQPPQPKVNDDARKMDPKEPALMKPETEVVQQPLRPGRRARG